MKYEIDKILIAIKHYKMFHNSWIIIRILEHVTCSMIVNLFVIEIKLFEY